MVESKISMVDITSKKVTHREAIAEGFIKLRRETINRVKEGRIEKGDVFSVATIAAIMAVKNTPNIIPLTHNIPITSVKVSFNINNEGVKVVVHVKTDAKTGVEMEALTGVSAALLAIWDMVKKYEKDRSGQYPTTMITNIRVVSKVKEP